MTCIWQGYYLAYYATNQREVFPFSEGDKAAIAEVIEEVRHQNISEAPKKVLLLSDE